MAEQAMIEMKAQMDAMQSNMQALMAENNRMKSESAMYAEKVRANARSSVATDADWRTTWRLPWPARS